MKVLLLSECLLVAVLLQHLGEAVGQFTPAPPTCIHDTITFECTVGGESSGLTLWRVGDGGGGCSLFHSSSSSTSTCGPGNVFTAMFENASATSFPSTLSGTATRMLNGTLVECLGPAFPGNVVGSDIIQIIGPPSLPSLSCVDLFGDTDGAVIVTVNWALSGVDGADFYLINISTNDPQPPYDGLLNVTTAGVTQHELTGFQAGYEYDIRVHGVNCGNQEGNESEPLAINPKVPDTPRPEVCAVYDQVNRTLQAIQTAWDEVDAVTVSVDCINGQNIRASYELSYTSSSGTSITTCVVNGTDCSDGVCFHELQNNTADSRCQPPVPKFNSESVTVTMTAQNIVGRSNPAMSRKIGVMNAIFVVEVDTTNPANASVECMFEPGYTCIIDYGTSSSYTSQFNRDKFTTFGQLATITLSQELQRDITYYFTVSAESTSQCVRVRGKFRTECSELDLGITTAENRMLDQRCVDSLFVNSSFIINGVVCYNGTTAMSEAVYICDDNSHLIGEATRVCQNDGNWNGSTPHCMSQACTLSGWNISLIVISTISLVVAITILTIIILGGLTSEKLGLTNKIFVKKLWWVQYCIPGSLIVNSGLLLIIGIVLWSAYAAVVSSPPKEPCVLPSIKGGLMFQFVFDIGTLIDVAPFTIAEFIHLFMVNRSLQAGKPYAWYLHVAYRVIIVIFGVLYMIGDVLWIEAGYAVAILQNDDTIYTSHPLKTGQLVSGGILLGIVLMGTIVAQILRQKYEKHEREAESPDKEKLSPQNAEMEDKIEWWQIPYFSLITIGLVFSAIGVALWIAVGVVVSNPPSDNLCDLCWLGSRDGLVISGLVFSILALIYAAAAVIWVCVYHKCHKSCCTVMMIILLCLSVIGSPFLIAVWYFNKGDTEDTDGGHELKAAGTNNESIEMGENPAYITVQPGKPASPDPLQNQTCAQLGEDGGEGGGQEYSHIQHGKPPNPSDPKYSHLNQGQKTNQELKDYSAAEKPVLELPEIACIGILTQRSGQQGRSSNGVKNGNESPAQSRSSGTTGNSSPSSISSHCSGASPPQPELLPSQSQGNPYKRPKVCHKSFLDDDGSSEGEVAGTHFTSANSEQYPHFHSLRELQAELFSYSSNYYRLAAAVTDPLTLANALLSANVITDYTFNVLTSLGPENETFRLLNAIRGHIQEHPDRFHRLLEVLCRDTTLFSAAFAMHCTYTQSCPGVQFSRSLCKELSSNDPKVEWEECGLSFMLTPTPATVMVRCAPPGSFSSPLGFVFASPVYLMYLKSLPDAPVKVEASFMHWAADFAGTGLELATCSGPLMMEEYSSGPAPCDSEPPPYVMEVTSATGKKCFERNYCATFTLDLSLFVAVVQRKNQQSKASYEAFLCGPAYPKTGSWNATFSISLSHPVYQKYFMDKLRKLQPMCTVGWTVLWSHPIQFARLEDAVQLAIPQVPSGYQVKTLGDTHKITQLQAALPCTQPTFSTDPTVVYPPTIFMEITTLPESASLGASKATSNSCILVVEGAVEELNISLPLSEQSLDEKPTDKDLMLIKWKDGAKTRHLRIIDNICNEWEQIGTILGIPAAKLQMWSMQAKQDPQRCCKNVIHSWLQNPPEEYPLTWGGFIDLLEDIPFKELAKELREALIHKV